MGAAALIGLASNAVAITGGKPANPAAWPEIVALYEPPAAAFRPSVKPGPLAGQFCAGSLVAPDKVISAAHCFVDGGELVTDPSGVRVRSGDPTLSGDAGEEAGVADLAVPPLVSPPDNPDIAVLTLDRPLTARPIDVPADATWALRPGARVGSAGWGVLSSDRSPTALRSVALDSVTNGSCRTLLPVPEVFGPGFDTCAGDVVAGGVDTCSGDSGGPLVGRRPDGTRVLVGVTSRGIDCGAPFLPGVYARPDTVSDWLAVQGVPIGPPVVPSRGRDSRRPRIRVLDTVVRVGRPLETEYVVADDRRRTSEELILLSKGRPIDFSQTEFGRVDPDGFSFEWRERTPRRFAGRTLVACGTAVDRAGNVSRRSCGRIQVRR